MSNLNETLAQLDRLVTENIWRRPVSLALTPDAAQVIFACYPDGPGDQMFKNGLSGLIGRAYAGVPIVSVTASEISLGYPKLADDDFDATPLTRSCSLEEGGACESCQ